MARDIIRFQENPDRTIKLEKNVDLRSRTFSTGELTAITGASPAAIANWKRAERGILPARASVGWPQYPVEDAVRVSLLVEASELGFSLAKAQLLAERGLGTVLALLQNWPGAIAAWDDLPEDRQRRVKKMPRPEADELFLVATKGPDVEGAHSMQFLMPRGQEVRSLGEIFAGHEAKVAVVIDLWAIANSIIERAGLPLFEIATDADGGRHD